MQDRSALAPEPGTVIAGKYRVGRVLASGGMGMILEGEHTALGQKVAIKYLLPAALEREDMVGRFLREARAAARIPSERVARVFDVGTDEGGRPYMVMELLEGDDLGAYMEARGALPIADAVRFILEALEAIIEAHALGIVHRDLKPSNLFVVTKGAERHIKVLDFGISKVSSEAGAPELALTSTKSLLGSPGYMSPEQVRSTKSVDARTDVWALGVILFEMLSAQTAFDGESLGDVFAKIREEDLPSILEFRDDVPPALAAVLARCLERDRKKRIATSVEMRDALKPFASLDVAPKLKSAPRVFKSTSTTAPTLNGEGSAVERARILGESATMSAPAQSSADADPKATQKRGGGTLATWSGERGPARRSQRTAIGVAVAAIASGAVVVGWLVLKGTPGGEPRSGAASAATLASSAEPTRERAPLPALTSQTSVTMGDSAAPFNVPGAPPAASSAAASSAAPSSVTPRASAPRVVVSAPRVTAPPPAVKPPEDLGI